MELPSNIRKSQRVPPRLVYKGHTAGACAVSVVSERVGSQLLSKFSGVCMCERV